MASIYPPSTCTTQTCSTSLNSYAGNTFAINGNITSAASSYSYTLSPAPHPSLHVTGKAHFEDDIVVNGRSLEKLFNDIENRLAILTPDPKKLEKWEALQKAYDHYKLLEKLLHEDNDD